VHRAAKGKRCTARYAPSRELDELVWQDLCHIVSNPDLITNELERAQAGDWMPQALQAKRTTARQALASLERQQDRLLDVYLAEIIMRDEFERKRQGLSQTQKGLHQPLRQLEHQAQKQIETLIVANNIQEFCNRIQPTLGKLNFEQRRQLVELLIDRVVVDDEKVEIRYVIPTSPSGENTRFCHLRTDNLDPHPASVIGQSHAPIGQIGCQAPELFFADFPMRQQAHRVDLALCQLARTQPNALTGFLTEAAKVLPTLLFMQPHLGIGFLPQNVEPLPGIQLAQDFHQPELGVANQENRSSFGEQLANIGQQSQLLPSSTMAAHMFRPSPGNRNGAFPIGQADDQQLMTKPYFRPIHDQTNLSKVHKLGFQQLTRNRLIPRSHLGWLDYPAIGSNAVWHSSILPARVF
jgi:hypothetical protein